jgi:hypothetical protein
MKHSLLCAFFLIVVFDDVTGQWKKENTTGKTGKKERKYN